MGQRPSNYIVKGLVVLMLMVALILYYIVLGPSAFPDYDNYQTIARNGGYLFSPDEYFFEYFSRGILTSRYIQPENAVDLLVLISQFFTFFYIFSLMKERPWNGLMQTSLTSVAFLTTIIRAAPAYEMIGYLCMGKITKKKFFLCGAIAIGWHDTAVIPLSLIGFVYLIRVIRLDNISLKILNNVYLFGVAIFIFPDKFKEIIGIIFGSLIGIRTIYFETDGGYSAIKIIYSMGIYLSTCYLTRLSKLDKEKKLIIYGLNIFGAIMYSINSVAGIRFSLFTITVFLALYDFNCISNKIYKYLIAIGFITLYFYSYIDILKNTI